MPPPTDQLEVVHQPDKKRFAILMDDTAAVLEYIPAKNYLVFTHTEVPPSYEGQGLASKLAHAGLEYAQEQSQQIMPLCPYVAMYIRRHPEYKSLVLPGFNI